MKSIDFKSLLIGILGTALVMVLMGQSKLEKKYDIECVSFYKPEIHEIPYVTCRRFDIHEPELGKNFNDSDSNVWKFPNFIYGEQI